MARFSSDSRERVRDAVDMIDLVGTRTELKRAGRQPLPGAVPVPRRAHAVVRDRPDEQALPLLRLRQGRRLLHVRAGDRGHALPRGDAVPRRPLQRRAGGRGRGSAGGGAARAARAAARAAGAHRDVLRASSVGVAGGRGRAAVPGRARPGGGDAARVPRRLRAVRVGHRAAGVAPGEVLQPGDRGRGAGGAQPGGPDLRPLPPADHVPAVRRARPRARLRRAGAGRRPAAEVPQLARGRRLPQGPPALRGRHRARGGGEVADGDRGRGLHGRADAPPGRA